MITDDESKTGVFKRSDARISKNAIGFRPLTLMKMADLDFMEVNRLAEGTMNDRNSIDDDDGKNEFDVDTDVFRPYFYNRPVIPFRTNPSKTPTKSNLEDFGGYNYPKPQNPMAYPEKPIKITTAIPEDDLPPASARSFS